MPFAPAVRPARFGRAWPLVALAAALGLGAPSACIDTPEDACSDKKPCPSGQFCAADGVCLLEEVCSGTDVDGDGRIDEAPAAAACQHADHAGTCARNGDGCACTDPLAFDVDGDTGNGCERGITGDQVSTVGEVVETFTGLGPEAVAAFAVGGLGRVAWVADGKVRLATPPESARQRSSNLGAFGETYVAEEGAEVAVLELDLDPGPDGPSGQNAAWAVVAERREPSPALMLFSGIGLFTAPAVDLGQAGIADFGAPTIAFVPLGQDRLAVAVMAYGRASPTAPAAPLLWLVPLVAGDDPLVPFRTARPKVVDVGGGSGYRADVAPRVQRGPTDGTLQTVLVGAPEGPEVARSEVLINTFSLEGAEGDLTARSTATDRFQVDGTIISHLSFPADQPTGSNGLYLANLVDYGATASNPLMLANIGTDGRFVRSETALDPQGNRAVDLSFPNLNAEAMALIGAGEAASEALCMPVLAPLGDPASGGGQISVVMFGQVGAQRADGIFDAGTPIHALHVSTYGGSDFWSAWTRSDAGGVSLRRARAFCR